MQSCVENHSDSPLSTVEDIEKNELKNHPQCQSQSVCCQNLTRDSYNYRLMKLGKKYICSLICNQVESPSILLHNFSRRSEIYSSCQLEKQKVIRSTALATKTKDYTFPHIILHILKGYSSQKTMGKNELEM